jgi:hypothetical protein
MFRQIIILFILISCQTVIAQQFISPVENLPANLPVTIVKVDGTVLSGTMSSYVMGKGIVSLTIKDEAGKKIKLKGAEVQTMKVKATGFVKAITMADRSESLTKMMRTDFSEIKNRDSIIFEQALVGGKEKSMLLQLINPGFDQSIKVYYNPSANETGSTQIGNIQLGGGEKRAYLVVKNNDGKAFDVRKGSFKKSYDDIFIDCLTFMQAMMGEKIRFDDFDRYVWIYTDMCK